MSGEKERKTIRKRRRTTTTKKTHMYKHWNYEVVCELKNYYFSLFYCFDFLLYFCFDICYVRIFYSSAIEMNCVCEYNMHVRVIVWRQKKIASTSVSTTESNRIGRVFFFFFSNWNAMALCSYRVCCHCSMLMFLLFFCPRFAFVFAPILYNNMQQLVSSRIW